MPWTPLPRLAFAICTYPFVPSSPADLPLQIGDELYIIEEGGRDASWFRGYLVAPPSLLSGLTTSRGQTLEKRVFTGIFPRVCVEIRELLGDSTGHERSPSVLGGDRKRRSAQDLSKNSPKRAQDASPDPQSAAGQDESFPLHSATPSSLATSHSGHGKPPAPVPMLKIGDESDMAKQEPLIDEIASCLREWHSTKLHDLLLSRQYAAVEKMAALVARLDYARKQLFHQVLTDQELEKLRESTIWDLVKGNKMLDQDVVVRSTEQRGRILTYEDSAVDINRQQAVMSLLDERPSTASDSKAPFHVYVNLKSFTADSDRQTTIGICLYSKRLNEPPKLLSEIYTSDTTSSFPGMTVSFDGMRKTLFTDISPSDAGEGLTENASLFLVVKMVSNEPPVLSHSLQASLDKAENSEDVLGNLSTTFRNAGQAGLKGGRQSIMWVRNRNRRTPDAEARTGSRLGTGTSETSDPKAVQPLEGPKKIKPVKKLAGLGIADITKHVRLLHEGEISIQVTSPDASPADASVDQSAVLAHILGEKPANGPPRAANANLSLYVKGFRADNADDLIQETPTLLHNITRSHRLGFASAPRRPRSDIYVTLKRPSINDNASLSHPRAGSVPAFEDKDLSNLLLTLEVRDTNGNRIDKCIFSSANASGAVAWRSTAVERGEWWNQTIRLAIRPEQVPGSHLVMSLAEGYGFPFALCWMPLWVQGAFVQDGQHNLALYKYDEYTSTTHSGKGAYLALPWNLRNKDIAVTGPLASVEMSTFLCSTAYSQDPNLLGLLHWGEKRHEELAKLLNKFPFVPEIEIVKLLKDVLNAIFGAMCQYNGNDDFEELLFSSLTTVLAIVNDRRFNLQPALDNYIAKDFKFPLVFPTLVRSFTHLLKHPTNTEKSRRLRSTCKVGAYVIKFIVRAQDQSVQAGVGIGIQSSRLGSSKELRPIFEALYRVMEDSNPVLVGTKTLMVQNLHSWLRVLSDAASPEEVLTVAGQFVDSCSGVQGRLVLYKLLLIKHITDENVFRTSETQARWQRRVSAWLSPYWGSTEVPNVQWREQIRLCCSVVSSLFTNYGANTSAFSRKLVESFKAIKLIPRQSGEAFSLLFPTAYPFPTRPTKVTDGFDEALIEIAALLAATTSAPQSTYSEVASPQLAQILLDLLDLTRSVLGFEAFPSSWLSVHIYNHRSIYTALESMFALLCERFLPLPDDASQFRDDLWRSFLETLIQLVSSDALALETFPEQKRRAVWKIGGDVRELGAELLGRSWHTLGWETSPEEKSAYGLDRMGGYQVSYVPGLVGSVLELCLSVHEGLRNVATSVIHSMIVSEWTLNGNLQAIETAMIDSLNNLYTTKTLSDGMLQKQFIDELRARFRSVDRSPDRRLYTAVMDLLDSIGQLFDLLVAVHAPEASSDTLQIMDTLRLMEYLRDMAKVDIFIGYVYKLANIQQKLKNFTEAALAMKLHADLHPWDSSEMLPRIAGLPFAAQSAFDRKEQIYFEMIKLFEDAQDWHQALQAYAELALQYQSNVFDFTKLARAQRAMATIYEKINNGERPQSRFFRVLYRGLGFPVSLRDKQFVFQAAASDRLASFTDKMQQQYPGAQFVSGAPLDEIEGQYLSIYPISPQKDFSHPVNRRVRTAQPVKEYLMLAAPRQFANTTRRQAITEQIEDQVQEKIVYTTADAFPTITKRSEIISVETVRMTPVQIGLERTARKTQDLQGRINTGVNGGDSALGSLTDELTMLISPKGTVAGYWKLVAGVTTSSADARSSVIEGVDPLQASLKVALLDHVLMIRRALDLYTRPAQATTKASLAKDLELTFGPVVAYLETLKANTSSTAPAQSVFARQPVAKPAVDNDKTPQTQSDGPTMKLGKPGLKVFGINGAETDLKPDTQRLSKVESHNSDVAAIDIDGNGDLGGARSKSVGNAGTNPVLSAQTSIQSLGARVGSVRGSVTKRLSALNLGTPAFPRKGAKGPPASPTIREV